jgi:2-polyprenyl-3-methyl-5-hydroxy-6-metoxy-1,4-benzoquinol methylase
MVLVACGRDAAIVQESKPATAPPPPDKTEQPPAALDSPATLERDQNEYVEDVMAFTKTTREQVRDRMKKGSEPLKEEWLAWEKHGPMTEERITAFYKQTANYIYELGEWHLFVAGKRESDMQLVEDMRVKYKAKNVLDFGGGVGMVAIPIARAGIDVTLADLDGTSLDFAAFRAKRHSIPLKIWKTDVEKQAPDKKYDVILALDVLEHLPREVLNEAVDRLIALKHPGTHIIISAPFGRTSVHPMHLDADENTRHQIKRLQTELPP